MRVTLKDIAREAGVSLTTASRIINGTASEIRISPRTEARVLDIVGRRGYSANFLAKGLRSGKTGLVGVVTGSTADSSLGVIFQGIQGYLKKQNMAVMSCASEQDPRQEKEAVEFLLGKHVEGIIIFSTLNFDAGARRYVAGLAGRGTPVVCLGRRPRGLAVPFVGHDNRRVGYLAARYLLESGCRHIICLTNTFNCNTIGSERRDGYAAALREAGRPVSRRNVLDLNTPSVDYDGDAAAAVEKFLDAGGACDGIFAHCDQAAAGAMRTLERRGLRVPADVAVVGVDNNGLGRYLRPSLTSVVLDDHALGEELAATLCGVLRGRSVESRLPAPALAERESGRRRQC